MSTTLQRKRWAPTAVADADADVDVDVCIVSPPCAGMTQIRFDGRSVGRFLSARLTGLPWFVAAEYTAEGR
jgi:hypothetical protein